MDSCELTVTISALACCIADGRSPEEIALISSIFVQIGDSLATMAAHQALCAPKDTSNSLGEAHSSGRYGSGSGIQAVTVSYTFARFLFSFSTRSQYTHSL